MESTATVCSIKLLCSGKVQVLTQNYGYSLIRTDNVCRKTGKIAFHVTWERNSTCFRAVYDYSERQQEGQQQKYF